MAPTVAILAPPAGSQIEPGPLDVVVAAVDAGGLSSITLECSIPLSGCGATQPVSPPATQATRTFTLEIPDDLVAPASLTVTARATDVFGNPSAPAARTFDVRDLIDDPPTVFFVSPSPGTEIVEGALFWSAGRAKWR